MQKNKTINNFKDIVFNSYLKTTLKKYGIKTNNRILLKYIESSKFDIDEYINNTDWNKYLKDNNLLENVEELVNETILLKEDYIAFQNDKVFILDKLLNNVRTFDKEGKTINIRLDLEQKEIVIDQYNSSFDDEVKTYIENNIDEFEEIFIADSKTEFEKLFPKTYVETLKEQALNNFINTQNMEAVRYCLAFPDEMKSAMSREYVNNDKFKTLLVFNNINNVLKLSKENLKEEKVKENDLRKEKIKEQEKPKIKEVDTMSIFITLSGKEKETPRGIYLSINDESQIYIPKQLYKKSEDKLEILSSKGNQALMSEYKVNNIEHTRTWVSRLNLDDFYHKYYSLYEIQREKEVMI